MNNWYLLAAIPVFGLIVLIHELGHFATAKWAGIRVDEFGLGFPPRMFGVKRGETIYSINWLPIGGFVRMQGENGETESESGGYDPRSFASKPASKRLIVLVAGIVMNILLAFVLFMAAEMVPRPLPYVQEVTPNSPAAQAGLHAGDKILSINGHAIRYFDDVPPLLQQASLQVEAHAKTFPVVLVVQRPDAAQAVTLHADALTNPDKDQGRLGFQADTSKTANLSGPIWNVPGLAVQDMSNIVTGTVSAIGAIVRGVLPWNQAVSGPVGIVHATGQVASVVPILGPYWLLYFTAAISMSLAFANALPIPALDGGRILFVLIEVLRRGKRLTPEREGLVNLIGMGVLLLLMLVVTLNDIGNLLPH